MSKKVLIVLTSHDRLGNTGQKTGFWLEEMAAPYYVFKDAAVGVTLASPKGGQSPIDPGSDTETSQTDATRRFKSDPAALADLANTLPLVEVKSSDYDAVFYAGGYGPLWDLVSNQDSIRLIEQLWAAEKPVAAVCHGPSVLVNAHDQHGEYILKGRRATGFTNAEEEGTGLTAVVPFLLEDVFVDRGANFAKGPNYEAHVATDGKLITGQNPASSEQAAQAVLERLNISGRLDKVS